MKNKFSKSEYALYAIFSIYIVMLFKIILFKNYSIMQVLDGSTQDGFRSVNLIPFKTIYEFINIGKDDFIWGFSNIIGNIGVFMPLGYLLPMIFSKANKLTNILLISFLLSLFFEVTQYTVYLGTADIDDLILNTLGGVTGYIIYNLIKKVIGDKERINKISFILGSICFVIAFTIVREKFGNLLGLTTHEVTIIGDENIPKTAHDIRGTLISLDEDEINMHEGIISEESSQVESSDKLKLDVNEDTQVYYTFIEESKNESIINYEEISNDEFKQIEEYSIVRIWSDVEDSELAKVIVVQEKIDNSTIMEGESTSMEIDEVDTTNDNQEDEISGIVEEIKDDKIILNLAEIEEFEDGSSTSIVGIDEYANLVDVEINDDTKFKLHRIKPDGELIESKDCTNAEIKKENSVDINASTKGDKLIANNIDIYEIVK